MPDRMVATGGRDSGDDGPADASNSFQVDMGTGTLLDQARMDAAAGRTTSGTRGSSDTEATRRLVNGG